ncbi:putative repeat protein (TIGR03943 family) [Actinomycetospora succinea]|uniref:Putative repeat protein (TIGR03943 family) n=1 Tax=Actinomycetospora succinea TaxID=663603 RepID=A0A4R6V1V3_9PSEU|nr:TIGR03943 family protein [Actinomycetospora succinea]TDQ53970.1 putative repeat protein (TIGR03943 family) [Actinomycetospora succinea]
MSRDSQHVLLVLVGGVLVKIVADGSYLRYVRPWSAVPVLAAGVVLITVAVVGIVRDLRGRAVVDGHDHGDGAGPEAGHDSRAGPSAWMLVLPVLALLLVVPPALGSAAVGGVGARAAPVSAVADDPLPAGEAPALGLLDVVSRAAADPFGQVTTREVTVTGFLVPARHPPPGTATVDLARWVITCCAADAATVRVHLADPQGQLRDQGPGGPEGDRWVAVRGRVVAGTGTPADGHVPTLAVTSWSPVATPDPVYEY